MLSKIRRVLGLESLQEKLNRFEELTTESKKIDHEIDVLASTFTSKHQAYKSTKNFDLGSDLLKSIEDKWSLFIDDHKTKIVDVKRRQNSVNDQLSELKKDSRISKASVELEAFDLLKSNYKSGKISPKLYDTILKAKNGKVMYSDVIVWNEKGEMLIMQRAGDENAGKWVIAGGHVDKGESHYEAAKRELSEETGIFVDDVELIGSYSDENCHIEYYEARVDNNAIVTLQNGENQDFKWISPYDIDDYDFIFNMKDNIRVLLVIPEKREIVIGKAIEKGLFTEEQLKEKLKEILKSQSREKVTKVMNEFKNGTLKDSHGNIVTDRKQAIAIAMSEAGLSKGESKPYDKLVSLYARKYNDWNTEKGESKGYKKPTKESVLEFFQNSHEDEANNEEMKAAVLEKLQEGEIIEKSRVGTYSDTSENRRLKRVGQKYGSKKEEDQKDTDTSKKEEEPPEPKKMTPDELLDHAKNVSVGALENAIKESGDPEVRQAAHTELQRREKEEHPQEEKEEKDTFTNEKPKEDKGETKPEPEKKESGDSNLDFDEWFEGSKVVDKEGTPLIVYHGTNDDFEKFEPSYPRDALGNFKGVYFTSDKSEAEDYGKKIKKVFLSIKNPIIGNPYEEYAKSKSIDFEKNRFKIKKEQVEDWIKENGFDGIIRPEGTQYNLEGAEYIVFNSNQIRYENEKNKNKNVKDKKTEPVQKSQTNNDILNKIQQWL